MPSTPDPAAAARALSSIPPEPELSSPTFHDTPSPRSSTEIDPSRRPAWARAGSATTSSSSRLQTGSRRFSRSGANGTSHGNGGRATSNLHASYNRLLRNGEQLGYKVIRIYNSLTPLQRIAAIGGIITLDVLVILFLVYSHSIFAWLAPISHKWRALPGGWLIAWLLTFACAFPPMIGYSTSLTIAGFVYGFPWGYPIVATATVAGSLCAFVTSRTVFAGYVQRMVGRDHRFVALGQVLRREGLGMLTAVRLCPLPYSISNGFLATIPTVRPMSFAMATAIASPKLLVHVFIGSRLALIAEKGDEMSAGDKAINYISMILGLVVGLAVGWIIYNRTMARAAELTLEEANENHNHAQHDHSRRQNAAPYADDDEDGGEGGESGIGSGLWAASSRRGNADFDYTDVEAGLVDPEDVAALMEEDDISLWENGRRGEYHDDVDEDGDDAQGTRNGHANTNGAGTK